jgi:integrase
MATITRRASGWSVQIRRKGYPPAYRTFQTKAEAARWAREQERSIDRGDSSIDTRGLSHVTLADLIRRYLIEVTPTKRSSDSEALRLRKMLRAPICSIALRDLGSKQIAAYRDARLATVRPGTIIRELSLIHSVLDTASREWDYKLDSNPVAKVAKPRLRNARDRRLNPGELQRLEAALAECRNPLIAPAVMLAIETALRRGELLKLEWRHIDAFKRTAYIPDTKTGYARTVPLTDGALSILDALPRNDARVFPMTAMALKLSWNRVRVRARVPDLRIHDLRHEAISRFAEMGLSTVELAVISGHRDPRMLFRYTHIRPADLARKLRGRSWVREIGT